MPDHTELPPLPAATLWMTRESRHRLSLGGNARSSVPVHNKPSVTAILPLYTEEEMLAFRAEGIEVDRSSQINPAVAAIKYALECCDSEADSILFLQYWNEGEFEKLRRHWENLPDDIFIGADPLWATSENEV